MASLPPWRQPLLSLFRRALRLTYKLPNRTFPVKVRYNIREMVETPPYPPPSPEDIMALIAEGEEDLEVLEKLAQQPPEVFAMWHRKLPAGDQHKGNSPRTSAQSEPQQEIDVDTGIWDKQIRPPKPRVLWMAKNDRRAGRDRRVRKRKKRHGRHGRLR